MNENSCMLKYTWQEGYKTILNSKYDASGWDVRPIETQMNAIKHKRIYNRCCPRQVKRIEALNWSNCATADWVESSSRNIALKWLHAKIQQMKIVVKELMHANKEETSKVKS